MEQWKSFFNTSKGAMLGLGLIVSVGYLFEHFNWSSLLVVPVLIWPFIKGVIIIVMIYIGLKVLGEFLVETIAEGIRRSKR